jgi:alkylation response protein AidB-like acyl-CoA dehydrogenase
MFSISGDYNLENFKIEVREQLKAVKVPNIKNDTSLESFIEVGRSWQKLLASKNLIAVNWPTEYGGRGLSLVEEAAVQEELARIGAPQLLGLFGLTMAGPILIEHGTEKQKKYFLKPTLSGDLIWCQGFSEPGAGSDLAAISTVAKRVDNHQKGPGYIVSGQKVWTSFAQVADWCFALVRTGEESARYKNLTYVLIDMKSPGVTIRPLRQITGDDEFNEVFFDEVYIPESMRVGAEGDGWKIAIGTLMHERVILTFARQIQSEKVLRRLLSRYKKEISVSELKTDKLFNLLLKAFSTRALAYKHLEQYAKGQSPGPEGSLDKLGWSEFFQELSLFALELEGPEALYGGPAFERYLYSRGRTIAAGTSEVQRNIIAERVLGMPRR